MQKLKKAFTHDHGKSAEAAHEETPPQTHSGPTGEGSHFASAKESYNAKEESQATSDADYHPIYDQMTGHGVPETSSTEPTTSTGQPADTSNVEGLQQTSPNTASTLSPATTSSAQQGSFNEGTSTASIKSGVLGFPQEKNKKTHAALNTRGDHSLDATQATGPALSEQNDSQQSNQSSDLARDAAIGAGAAGTARQLHHQRDHDNLRASSEQEQGRTAEPGTEGLAGKDFAQTSTDASQQPFERSFQQEPKVTTETDRSFPLAGGVTSRKHDDPTTSRSATSQPQPTSTIEREPGTKEKETGVKDNHGREKLAGAAALAAGAGAGTYAYRNRSDKDDREVEQERANQGHGALTGVTGTSSTSAQKEHGQGNTSHNPEALAAATAAYSGKPSSENTANRTDPHLHVPGEFPETPAATPMDQKTGTGDYISGTSSRQPEPRSNEPTGTIGVSNNHSSAGQQREPLASDTTSTNDPAQKDHNYGRNAAIAGGVGAAGLGAYAYNKHDQRDSEPAGVGENAFSNEPSPYSSTKMDPRVNPHAQNVDDQTVDATSATTQSTLPQQQARETMEQPREEKSDNHNGRNAALAGAGAATAGGLYYASQRDGKSDTGPASKTVGPHESNVANVLDPRVQPDPEKQKHHQSGPTSEDPASHTIGPHESNVANVLDPRVQPDPEKQRAVEPTNDQQHHYGRDAAIAGGAGAAGYGAYEAAKGYSEHPSTQPAASMEDQRYDPTAPGAHDPNDPNQVKDHHYGRNAAVAGGLGAAGAGAYAASRHNDSARQGPVSETSPQPQDLQQDPRTQTQQSYAQQGPYDSNSQAGVELNEEKDHHYGRNAAIAGGAGAAGAGAYALSRNNDSSRQPAEYQNQPTSQGLQQDPTTQTQQPYAQQGAYAPQTQTQAAHDPEQTKDHHYGRNAALAGGAAGAAGAGAYALSRNNDSSRQPADYQTQPASQGFQQQDSVTQAQPSTQGFQQDPTTQTQKPYQEDAYNGNATTAQDPEQSKDHHYGRNAAIAGGVGAAGAGAYALSRNNDNNPQHQSNLQSDPTTQPHSQQQPSASQQPTTGATQHQRYDSVQDPNAKEAPENHDKRNAALAGTAGVAAGAGGAYAYSQREAEKAEKQRLAEEKAQQKAQEKELAAQQKQQQKDLDHQRKQEQKELEKKQKEADKEAAKKQKEADKEAAKKQKEADKAAEKERNKEQKKLAKEDKRHQKEIDEENARREKEREREAAAAGAAATTATQARPEDEKEGLQQPQEQQDPQQQFTEGERQGEEEEQEGHEKKKHHLFGFLHRDKSKKEKDHHHRSAESSPRHSRDLASQEHAQDSDTSEGRKQRKRLHKDPPKGHPAREALEHAKEGEQSGEPNISAYDGTTEGAKGFSTEPHSGGLTGTTGSAAGGNTVDGYDSRAQTQTQTQAQATGPTAGY